MEKKKRTKVIKAMQEYKYHYGLKMRIYPSAKQKNIIRRNSDVARFVYNEFVAINKEISLFGKPKLFLSVVDKRIQELKARLSTTALKDRFPWLRHADVDSLAIANAIQNYRAAWNMFRKVYATGVPCFHKKSYRESYQTNPHYAKGTEVTLFMGTARFLDEEHLSLPKLKRVRCLSENLFFQKA